MLPILHLCIGQNQEGKIVPGTSQVEGFSPARLRMIEAIEQNHFWFLGRRTLVLALMRRFIQNKVSMLLDVGCGTGFNLQYWEHFADNVIGLDRLAGYSVHHCMPEKPMQSIISDVCALPVQSSSADVAVALDVLEHVPDEIMLSEVNRSLVNGGLFLVTVPATKWLWSSRDESAGHLRRYTRQSLRAVIEKSGFELLYINYYQCLLFPLVAISRMIGRSKESAGKMEETPGKLVNNVLNWITQFEVKMTRMGVRFPWGSTLVAVMRKV